MVSIKNCLPVDGGSTRKRPIVAIVTGAVLTMILVQIMQTLLIDDTSTLSLLSAEQRRSLGTYNSRAHELDPSVGNRTALTLARAAIRVRQLRAALAAQQRVIEGLLRAVDRGDPAAMVAALGAEHAPAQVALQHQLAAAEASIGEVADLFQERAVAAGQAEVYVKFQAAKVDARPLVWGVLKAPDPALWQQRRFHRMGSFGLWQFSAYRAGPDKVALICLAALKLHDTRQYDSCMWFSRSGAIIPGTLSVLYMNEHHGWQYENVVITCTLESPMGADAGHLVARIEKEELVVFREDLSQVGERGAPYPSKLTVCTPRLYGDPDEERLWEWFEYHRVTAGADRFILYNLDGIGPRLLERLGTYLRDGRVEITDFRDSSSFEAWEKAQGVTINDCIYRTRDSAAWVAFMDFDEFLEAVPPNTLATLLAQHAAAPWLTHGVQWWSSEHCVPLAGDGAAFAIERMRYHWPHDFCIGDNDYKDSNYCLEWHGHRKYIVNPRKVHIARVHSIPSADGDGVDLSLATEMRHHHFQHVLVRNSPKLCNVTEPHVGQRPGGFWVYDDRISEIVKRVRGCPRGSRECALQLPD